MLYNFQILASDQKKFLFFQAIFEQLSLQKATFDCFLSNFSFEQRFEKLQGTCWKISSNPAVESPICSIVRKGTVFKWDREPSGRTATMNADQLLASLGPGYAVGKKGRKRGQIGQTGKRSPSAGQGVRHPFLSPHYLAARFVRRHFFSPTPIFFSFLPQCEAWSQANY